MSTFKINKENSDLVIENNDLVLVTGAEEGQTVLIEKLRMYFSEWFLDNTLGITYFEDILVKNPDPAKVDFIFKNAILTSPGVEQLLEYDLDLDTETRALTLSFLARVNGEEIQFSEVLNG